MRYTHEKAEEIIAAIRQQPEYKRDGHSQHALWLIVGDNVPKQDDQHGDTIIVMGSGGLCEAYTHIDPYSEEAKRVLSNAIASIAAQESAA